MKHFHFIQYPPLPSPVGNKNGKEIVFPLILTIKTSIRSLIHGVGSRFGPIIKNLVWTCISSNKFMVCHYKFQYAMSYMISMIVKPILFTIMEHELLAIPEHLRSFFVRFVLLILYFFCVVFCRHCLSFFFLFTVAFSAFRFKTS